MSRPKKALFIIPHNNFRDKELTWVAERFDDAEVEYQIASTHPSEAKGKFGLIVIPDFTVTYVEPNDYQVIVLVGEEAAREIAADPTVRSLVNEAINSGVKVAAIGYAVSALLSSGAVSGKKLTSHSDMESEIKQAGAFYTGSGVEVDGNVITAFGPHSVREFAIEIIRQLQDCHNLSGREYLR